MRSFYDPDGWFQARRPRHAWLAAGALLFSLAAHVLVLSHLPSIAMAGLRQRLAPPPKRPPVVVTEVRREPPPAPTRPAEFAPSKPDQSFEAHPAPHEFVTALDPVLLEPAALKADLIGERAALQPPSPPPARTDWVPRQERLEIARQTVREDPVAPPRRLLPQLPRIADAPDIAPPSPPPSAPEPIAASLPMPVPGEDLAATGGAGGGRGLGPVQPFIPDGKPVADVGRPIRIAEASKSLGERPADVTGIRPIEQYLQLETRVYRPNDEPDAAYFSMRIQRSGAATLPVLPKDVLLIQDCSESMTQAKVDQCKKGLHAWLRGLNATDRFDLMSFREKQDRCFGEWKTADAMTRARAGLYVEQMESQGLTDIFGSLQQILALPREPGRPTIAVMISDGQPTMGLQDNFRIIQDFADRNATRVSVFAFGAGVRVNRFLLDFVSYKNRGDSMVVRERAEIPNGLEVLARELSRPVLADLHYRFSGLSEEDIYPRALTHLYLDRPLIVYGRVPAAAPAAGVQITGVSGPDTRDMVFRLDWAQALPGTPDLRTQWIWQKLNWLVGENIRTRNPEILREMTRLAALLGPDIPYAAELGIKK